MNEPVPYLRDLDHLPPEVKLYQRLRLTASLCSLLVVVLVLAASALWFGPRLGTTLQHRVGSGWFLLIVVALLYAVGLEVATLPLDFWSGFILEHCFDLSRQTFGAWLWRKVKGYLVGGPIGLVLVLGLYGLLWSSSLWWLWAALGWLAFTLLLGRLLPVLILPLFYKVTPLNDGALCERLQRVAAGTGLTVEGVYRLHLSAETRKANAALTGLGPTRRVLLGDTLLDEFTPEEIEVVFAHEVGHHVHRHLRKLVLWNVVTVAAGLWLVDVVLRHTAQRLGYASFTDPAALPLVMLVLSAFGLLLSPAQNALSRFFERQCDRYALERTAMPAAYRSAFIKLALMNKADPDPHPLRVWLFDDHPPVRQRLAMADMVLPP